MIACIIAAVIGIVLMIVSSAIAEGRDMRATPDFAWPMALIGCILGVGGELGLVALLAMQIARVL